VTLRVTDGPRIKARLQKQGHVILALDGLQPDMGHEVLWVVRDCLSEEILLVRPSRELYPRGPYGFTQRSQRTAQRAYGAGQRRDL